MKPCAGLMLAVLILSGCATTHPRGGFRPLPSGWVPQRVAVASFENRSGFEGRWKIGDGMADLLVSELVASKHFVVLERQNLDSVVGEIHRQRERLFRKEGRSEEGRLENARFLIRGVIQDFSQASGGALWMKLRRWLIGSGGYTARVGLTLTVVEIETGRVIGSVQSSGRARAGNAYSQVEYKGVHFGGTMFFQTPLGKATASAIREGLRDLNRIMPRERWRPMIAETGATQVILNGGKSKGIRVGQYYRARGPDRPITDPETGDLLDLLPGPALGTIVVIETRNEIALAEIRTGDGFERGQRLEEIPPPSVAPVAP